MHHSNQLFQTFAFIQHNLAYQKTNSIVRLYFYYKLKVFERGLKSIPLSVDLWIHYLAHVKQKNPDDEEYIRVQFDRALISCGLEFRSDKLWEAYIKWETEGKRLTNVINIYDRLLATPTQGYNGHFDR